MSDHVRELIEIHEQALRGREESTEEHDLVRQAMARIPERERDILMLRFYLDLSLQDMSDFLGLGLSATKMRLYRALDSFGARLASMRQAAEGGELSGGPGSREIPPGMKYTASPG